MLCGPSFIPDIVMTLSNVYLTLREDMSRPVLRSSKFDIIITLSCDAVQVSSLDPSNDLFILGIPQNPLQFSLFSQCGVLIKAGEDGEE